MHNFAFSATNKSMHLSFEFGDKSRNSVTDCLDAGFTLSRFFTQVGLLILVTVLQSLICILWKALNLKHSDAYGTTS